MSSGIDVNPILRIAGPMQDAVSERTCTRKHTTATRTGLCLLGRYRAHGSWIHRFEHGWTIHTTHLCQHRTVLHSTSPRHVVRDVQRRSSSAKNVGCSGVNKFIMSSLQHHNNAMLPYRCFPLHLLQLLDEVLPRISRLVVQQTGAEFCKYSADVFVAQVRLCGRPGLHHRHHTDPHAPIRQIGINERPEGVRPNEMYDVVRASMLTLGGASATTDCDDGSLFATSPHNTTTAAGNHPRPRYSHAESFSRTSP